MTIPLRVLIIDDSEDDTFLLVRYLTRGGFELTWQRVDTEAALVLVLQEKTWDMILSDFSMPRFNGLEALRVIRTGNYTAPVILVSGAIGEEIAVEAIKAGAQDYVLKDNLTRLGPSVERALREAQNRQARLSAEAALQESQARLLAETRQRLQELDGLNRISAGLRVANTTQDILPGYLEEVLGALNSAHGAVLLFNANMAQLVVARACGKFTSFQGMQLPLSMEWKSFLLDETALFVLADSQAGRFTNEFSIPEIIGPLMAVPMRSTEVVLGLLVVARDREEPAQVYTDNDRRLILTISELGGNALQRARLFEQTHQRVQRLSVLHAIDMAVSSSLSITITLTLILDQIVTQLNISAADVLTYNYQTNWLEYADGRGFRSDKVKRTRFRSGQSFPGNAILDRKPVSVMDLSVDPQFIQLHALEAERFSSYFAVPLVANGRVKGVLELFHREPILADPELRDYFESLAAQTALAMDNTEMFERLKRSNMEMMRANDAIIENWARSLELREHVNHLQTQRMAEITLRMGMEMGIVEDDLPHLRRGALLHDIGLVHVPEAILNKKEPLTAEDRQVISQHPGHAHELLAGIQFLAPAMDIPLYHQERWDGSGYPNGMKGDQIPLAARIFAVVDVWYALTSDRVYRPAWAPSRAADFLRQEAGKLFDPVVVEKFLDLLPQLERRFGGL